MLNGYILLIFRGKLGYPTKVVAWATAGVDHIPRYIRLFYLSRCVDQIEGSEKKALQRKVSNFTTRVEFKDQSFIVFARFACKNMSKESGSRSPWI